MKRIISVGLVMSMAMALCTGCGGSSSSGTAATTAAAAAAAPAASAAAAATEKADDTVYEISLGHIQNPGHSEAIAYDKLAELVSERTDGRIHITVYPSNQLGTEREMVEQCTQGTLDICASDGGGFATMLNIPEIGVFNLPFLYEDVDTQEKVINQVMMETATELFKDTEVVPIFCYTNGIRHALLKNHPINTLEDISGIKMRVPESTIYVNTWKDLGANPTTVPWGEVYTALSQGVAEACEADVVGLVNTNLQEVGKYLSLTGHMAGFHIIVMNKDSLAKLPDDLREIFLECCKENQAEEIASRNDDDNKALEAMKAAGVEINSIDKAERQRMIEACSDIYQEYRDMGMGDVIDRMLALGE